MKDDKLFAELFHSVQLAGLFQDSKTFADAIPKKDLSWILKDYEKIREQADFDLSRFVQEFFSTREDSPGTEYNFPSIDEHINKMWQLLERIPSNNLEGGSKISLDYPYIVPGGRFDEIYYWDSYFTFLGLAKESNLVLMKNMLDNFRNLIERYGHIPNGNRTYFLSRSQPPFFGSMINLYANNSDSSREEILIHYYPALKTEYEFWMNAGSSPLETDVAYKRVIQLSDSILLNRYYDELNSPRPESYLEDYEMQIDNPTKHNLMRNIRAACESGWDFSSRWFKGEELKDIHTLDIIPVDLNCLLYQMESLLSEMSHLNNEQQNSKRYSELADTRKKLISEILWNKENRFFSDYDWVKKNSTNKLTAAISFPLYFSLATDEQALYCKDYIENQLLKIGGIVTTPINSGQQWDAPNGWAPLQWITVIGLQNYGFHTLADEVVRRWVNLNKRTFQKTGKMMEKYDVVDPDAVAGGGEYPVQEGFGWSNGVYLAFQDNWYKDFQP